MWNVGADVANALRSVELFQLVHIYATMDNKYSDIVSRQKKTKGNDSDISKVKYFRPIVNEQFKKNKGFNNFGKGKFCNTVFKYQ